MQRLVVTSSCTSILQVSLPVPKDFKPAVFSEQDWNLGAIKKVEELGNKCPPNVVYFASKTLAEKGEVFFFWNSFLSFGLFLTCFLQSAAWDFYEQNKQQLKWDLTIINPPMVSSFFIKK